ncbi:MAG TPA: Bcr/CflA family multidrug efflux MFS transporter [Ktedonobacterales bacterium]
MANSPAKSDRAPQGSVSGKSPVLESEHPSEFRWNIRLVIILGALSMFGPLSIDMYLPSLPTLGHDLGASASQTQLTLSACLVGLALGQIIAGPISDTLGRRRPLCVGVAAYAAASLLCVIAPSVTVLILLRFIQGLAGAAGIVIARAIVRDLYSGIAVARFFSLLMVVNGLAPILAPIIGGQILRFTSWRGVFITLTIIGILLFLAAALGLSESLPAERRQRGGIRSTLLAFWRLLTDRAFVGYALACGLAFAAMFSYISGSPFVLQDMYGVSPQLFSIIFGINALGIMAAGQVNGQLVGRISPQRLLAIGLTATASGGIALLAVIIGGIGLVGILPALFVVVSSIGIVMPNATTLALANYPRAAGSASALLGVLQFIVGAAAAPLVGVAGGNTAYPMGIVIAALGVSALAAFVALSRTRVDLSSSAAALQEKP